MGCFETTVSTPTPPAAPTMGESVQEWADVLPQIYDTQMEYEPKMMESQLSLQKDYGTDMLNTIMGLQTRYQPQMLEQQLSLQEKYGTEAMKQQWELQSQYAPEMARQYADIQGELAPEMLRSQYDLQKEYMPEMAELQKETTEGLYPGLTGLREDLVSQARQGISGEVPPWMRHQYLSDLQGQMGTNVGSPIAADYISRSMLQQQQDYQRYYQGMGMGLTGGLPMSQPQGVNVPNVPVSQIQSPQYQQPQMQMPMYQGGANWAQGFSPQSAMGFNQQGYGSFSNLYGSMYGANAQNATSPFSQIAGAASMFF